MNGAFQRLENPLGLKAIAWNFNTCEFVSPSQSDFTWSREGLESAKCPHCGDNLPGEECGCGLYTTFFMDVASGYRYRSTISPILVMEVSGNTIISSEGLRSKQLVPKWVVTRYSHSNYDAYYDGATLQAADYFGIPRIDRSVASALVDLWNISLFIRHPEWFKEEDKDWRTWYKLPEKNEVADYQYFYDAQLHKAKKELSQFYAMTDEQIVNSVGGVYASQAETYQSI